MLSYMKFMYDGQPKIDFTETILYPLNAGLASISMDKNTSFALIVSVVWKPYPGCLHAPFSFSCLWQA